MALLTDLDLLASSARLRRAGWFALILALLTAAVVVLDDSIVLFSACGAVLQINITVWTLYAINAFAMATQQQRTLATHLHNRRGPLSVVRDSTDAN